VNSTVRRRDGETKSVPVRVPKCDNSLVFPAHLNKPFVLSRDVFTSHSPRYLARSNGASEQDNHTLKKLTEHISDEGGAVQISVAQ
jgi:hypothetical protein